MYLWSIFSILYITKAVSKHYWLIYVFPHFTLSENHLFCFHILSKEFKFTSSLIVCLSVTQYRHPVHLSSFDWNEHAYLNQHKSIYNTFQYQIWKWYIFSLHFYIHLLNTKILKSYVAVILTTNKMIFCMDSFLFLSIQNWIPLRKSFS